LKVPYERIFADRQRRSQRRAPRSAAYLRSAIKSERGRHTPRELLPAENASHTLRPSGGQRKCRWASASSSSARPGEYPTPPRLELSKGRTRRPANVQWAAAGKVCDEPCVLTVERVPNESRPNR